VQPSTHADTAGPGAEFPRLRAVACALIIVASTVVLAAWSIPIIARKNDRGPSSLGSVAELAQITGLGVPMLWLWLVAVAVVVVVVLLRQRALIQARTATVAAIGTLITIAATVTTTWAYYLLLVEVAAVTALAAGLIAPSLDRFADRRPSDRTVAAALWITVGTIMAVFTMHRFWAMGAGSWDMGCMIHNFYRASRFLDTTSTVLGDVDFLGDHFMLGIYLYAPIMWLNASGYALLGIQCANLSATAPAIFLIARHRGASTTAAAALGLAAGLSFGMQSAAYFDSHEIVVGFGFLAWGLWAFETGRLRLATALFVIFALFKESLGAYVVALGMLAIWRGLSGAADTTPRRYLRYGAAWIVFGAVWFVLVNRVFMPALIARANLPEPHETFADFGPTVFSALVGILSRPLDAVGALFVPSAKISSHLVTVGGVGWLAVATPQILIAAAPLVAERFLSSKATMWEMGYHYGAPLCLYAAWAAAAGWPKIRAAADRILEHLAAGTSSRAPVILAGYLIASTLVINGAGYPHPANFLRWDMVYFSTPDRRAANAEAVDLIEDQGRDARVAAQNRILPHLADRPVIYRLGEWAKADWVVLNVAESAWPRDDGFPRRLAKQLAANPDWRLVFSKGETAVFVRSSATDRPEVPPDPLLGLPASVIDPTPQPR